MSALPAPAGAPWAVLGRIRWGGVGRFAGAVGLGVVVFGICLLVMGRNPLTVYGQLLSGALGDTYGWTEIGVKLVPLVLCGLAAAVPARVGLVNVGAEGQLYIGAAAATWVALNLGGGAPGALVLPLMVGAGFLGGALWGGITGLLRALAGLNEAIATLLLNYVAVLVVQFLVHGPWKEAGANNWPFTPEFAAAARLPTLGDSRIHLGVVLPVVAVVALAFLFARTRWGYEMRVIGGNPEAARWSGIRAARYVVAAMLIGGGLAGLAGMAEVSAIQTRLRPGISNGYGYLGFLASWLALNHPLGVVGAAALLAAIVVGGDVLQLGANLPASTVNILMALILFGVLGARKPLRAAEA